MKHRVGDDTYAGGLMTIDMPPSQCPNIEQYNHMGSVVLTFIENIVDATLPPDGLIKPE